jgi:hypothetical protein
MFARRAGGHRFIAIVRDLVEIAAILAAGAWAVYTFVYLQRIKPGSEPPAATITGSMERLGERNGLVQFAYHAVVRNIGQMPIYLIGDSFTVVGSKYTSSGVPHSDTSRGLTIYVRSARPENNVLIYREVELSRFVNAKYGFNFSIDPGEQIPFSGVFLVRQSDADNITLYGSIAFTRTPESHPTQVEYTPFGAVYFAPSGHGRDYHSFEVSLDRASLW